MKQANASTRFLVAVILLISVFAAIAGQNSGGVTRTETLSHLAPTPPMGWNSFDSYCGHVNEDEVRANAAFMAKHLAPYGWKYIVVDFYWYYPYPTTDGKEEALEVAMDDNGRLLPATNRFPSAANGQGFKPLADYVHGLGLKFGIHIMRGIPRQAVARNLPILGSNAKAQEIINPKNTCSWSNAMHGVDTKKTGAQEYYDSIVALYAQWGVDYIKADDMSWGTNPAGELYHAGEIEALAKAIRKCGRPMVLSLSPGPTDLANAEHVKRHAQLWRISGDMWDNWKQIQAAFDYCRAWSAHIGPEHWPDADMLPLGRLRIRGFGDRQRQSRLTQDEQVTLMTLWSIARSPLMFGGDLPSIGSDTLSLLTNEEVIAVNQRSSGNREVFTRGNQVAWVADDPADRAKHLALFNLADSTIDQLLIVWNEFGLSGRYAIRDLWAKKNMGTFVGKFSAEVKPHGARLFKLTPVR